MTPIQLAHHQEQMEAYRAEFREYWTNEVLPKIKHRSPTKIAIFQHYAWIGWLDFRKTQSRKPI